MIRSNFLLCTLAVAAAMAAAALPHVSLAQAQQQGEPVQPGGQGQSQPSRPAVDPHASEERAAESQALGFLQYLDQGRFAESYAYTGSLIRAQMDSGKFAKDLRKARNPVGAEQSRKLLDASYTTKLHNAPDGQYVVLQYTTNFARKQNAVETLTLSFENGYWRIAGYFIK